MDHGIRFHTVFGIWMLLLAVVFSTVYTAKPKGVNPYCYLGAGVWKDKYNDCIRETYFPTHLTNKFKLRPLCDLGQSTRTESFFVASLTLIPYLSEVLPEVGLGLPDGGPDSFHLMYLLGVCLRKLSQKAIPRHEVAIVRTILASLYPIFPRFLGSNIYSHRFHLFCCHAADEVEQMGPIMNHTSAATEQSLHVLKADMNLTTHNYAKINVENLVRRRSSRASVLRLHEHTSDPFVKNLCRHIIAATDSTRAKEFGIADSSRKKYVSVGQNLVSVASTDFSDLEPTFNPILRLYLGQQTLNFSFACCPTSVKIRTKHYGQLISFRPRRLTGDKNSQRNIFEFHNLGDRCFGDMLAVLRVEEDLFFLAELLQTASILDGIPDASSEDLRELCSTIPTSFRKCFWEKVSGRVFGVVAAHEIIGPALIFKGAHSEFCVSIDTSFCTF